MKHCRSCEYCEMDLVAQYVKGIDVYKCMIDGGVIAQPFWDKCEKYKRFKKIPFSERNFIKLR